MKKYIEKIRDNNFIFWTFMFLIPLINIFIKQEISLLLTFGITCIFMFFKKTKNPLLLDKKINTILKTIFVMFIFITSSLFLRLMKTDHADLWIIVYGAGIYYQYGVFSVISFAIETYFGPKHIKKKY